ncbi:MBL fold metallo-hydrolase [Amorphus coralli]|uniref:MBL fold metallo-hydrolase n=1 Tax=Amorphus coralli TaxID=340680 RepID=UPI000424E5DC|nr:MBL fold metallo-hydrolase [Amorphus coralli]
MRVRIHRGTREIGGTCVEIEQGKKRIVLDVGLPLDGEENAEALLPDVNGFRTPDDGLLGIVISHSHQDHYGLAKFIRPEVPVYVGAAAERILRAAAQFTPSGAEFRNFHHFRDGETFELGPFRLTPYLVDHSAYDAYGILVEAGGKRLFYSGDFRGHGRKSTLFDRMLRRPPAQVDVLLMEGSSIGRIPDGESFPTEAELESEFVGLMHETPGMVLTYASGQNIDRLVTLFRACKKTGRTLIIDLYTAEILRATGNDRIPQGWWDGVRVFLPFRQRLWVKRNKLFELISPYRENRIFPEALKAIAPEAAMLFRPSMTDDLTRAECLGGARVVWSMWEGYLEDDAAGQFLAWMKENGLPMSRIHTSGHASVSDLRRFAKAVAPKRMIPIHSFATDQYPELFENVDTKEDGEWWEA